MSAGNQISFFNSPSFVTTRMLFAGAAPGIGTSNVPIIECRLGTSKDQPQWAVRFREKSFSVELVARASVRYFSAFGGSA
jgi:hypothetical protein